MSIKSLLQLILLLFYQTPLYSKSTTFDNFNSKNLSKYFSGIVAFENKNNSKSLHHYTSLINKSFSEEKKLLLIEILWEIVLSDGKIHDFESNLIRRLSGLLYISDINSGNARKRALDKISK